MTVWLLDGDESALRDAAQVAAGDLVVAPLDDGLLRVGVARPADDPPVRWEAEADRALLPEDVAIDDRSDGSTPLQRLEDAARLEAALEGVRTAARHRGG